MNKKFFTFDQLHSAVNDNSEYSPHLHYNSYSSSFDTTISPQYSSPYHDTDSVSDKSKKIRKKRNTYQKIADETRKKLLDAVQQGDTLKAAAKRYGINYSSAKSILHTFRKEGRICKKSAQERTSRRRTKSSQELEMSPIYLYKQCADDFNNGVNEASTYQTYHSPEDKSPVASEDEGPKAGVSGLAINSFGGFLKVNSKNQVSKGEPMAAKAPGSTIVLKLGSQRMQNVVRNDNWQLNVNVNNNGENQQVPYYKYNEDLQQNDSGRVQNAARQGNYGHYYMNYTESPLSQVAKKDQSQNPVRILGEVEEDYNNAVPIEGQGYDVSCFLSASPAYAFQQRKAYGLEQYGNNNENFSGMENNLRGIIDPQELYYDGVNYRPRMEEGTEGLVKRAGLSGY